MHQSPDSNRQLLIFGLGYTASRIGDALRAQNWIIDATGGTGNINFDDRNAVLTAINTATHIMSSVPPDRKSGTDPVLEKYGAEIACAPSQWIGYLSSTGVYGDAQGAWVDENSAIGGGRRSARSAADHAWQQLAPSVRIFRLPGIYGPGRSAFDRIRTGKANRIHIPDQIFSRVHVDDIVGGVIASLDGPPGIYNLADDQPCSQNRVVEDACRLIGQAPPPLMTFEEADLSPMARGFYTENRRVANGKAKRLLGWKPQYRDHLAGLQAILSHETDRVI